jgi:tetratricopeptide (TPR) repeat protein
MARHQDRAEVDNLLGLAEEKCKRYSEAIEAFGKAAVSEPGNEDYRFDYANSILQYWTSKEATAVFAKAAHDFPGSWRMRLGLGASYYLTGDYESAAQYLLEAVKLNPDSRLAFYLLGRAYESASSAQVAIAETFRAYLAHQPEDAWAYCHYGTILYLQATSGRRVDFTSAKLYLNKSLALDPKLAEAYLELGIIALAEGYSQESAQLLERAVQLKPGLAAAHYRLGLAYQRLGRVDDAKAEMDLFKTLKAERDKMIEGLAQRAH